MERREYDRNKIEPVKIGLVQFSGCSACALEITDILNFRLKIPTHIVMAPWNYEIADYYSGGPVPEMDLCFIEGAIGSEQDEKQLKEIRAKTTLLVGVGTCAASEKLNIGMIKNSFSNLPAKLPEDVVKIDHSIKGCRPKESVMAQKVNEVLRHLNHDYHHFLEGKKKEMAGTI